MEIWLPSPAPTLWAPISGLRDTACLRGAAVTSRSTRSGWTAPLSQLPSRDWPPKNKGRRLEKGKPDKERLSLLHGSLDGGQRAAATGDEDAGVEIDGTRTLARGVRVLRRVADSTNGPDGYTGRRRPHDAVWTTAGTFKDIT